MEKLPLTFVQATVDPDIMECFEPAFNFTKINASNGRLAFTEGKLYWLPEAPIAMLDQGWVINYAEIAGYEKTGLAGFCIKLVDGKKLQFSNVGKKMREGIEDALAAHKDDAVPAAPAAEAAAAPEGTGSYKENLANALKASSDERKKEEAARPKNRTKTFFIVLAVIAALILLTFL